MGIFDMITWADEKYRQQAYEINNQYFTIDTAEPDDVYDWVNHNRLMVTYALQNDRVEGFLNIMPLTGEAGNLFNKNQIREEEITIDEILGPKEMQYAEYLYLPAIAVRDYKTYHAHQCTAGLMSALASLLLNVYDPKRLKKLFVNPTTYPGHRMIQKLGLEPLQHYKRVLTSNDLYIANFTTDTFKRLQQIEKRYERFIGYNCWHEKEWLSKL